MNWKNVGKALLFPPMALMIILIPVATVFLVYSIVFLGTGSVVAVLSYVLSAYTFTSLTFAIINTVKYRKYHSPVYSASKAISLAASCVSVLTLGSTMLTTFENETMSLSGRRILLGISGGIISAFIIAMAIYMIATASKKRKLPGAAKE